MRAVFHLADYYDEQFVKAAVDEIACADSSNASFECEQGSRPIGANVGSFASGFTTAPDVVSTTFDGRTGTVDVLFDQRVFGIRPSNFILLDASGNALATPVQATSTATGGSSSDTTTSPGAQRPRQRPTGSS